MQGDLVQNAKGELYFIPEEMTDLLRLSEADVEATSTEVEGYGLATPLGQPSPLPLPRLDIGALQKQWNRFGPSLGPSECLPENTGAMGCPS